MNFMMLKQFSSWKGWILSNAFSVSAVMIMWFPPFILYYTDYFSYWNHPYIPGRNTVWLWHIIILITGEFCLLVFCWGLLHCYSSGIWVCSLVVNLSCFDSKAMLPSLNELEMFPLLQFSGRVWGGWCSSFKCLIEFTSEVIWSLAFLLERVLTIDSISLLVTSLLIFFYFLIRLCVSRFLSISPRLFNLFMYSCS